MKLSDISVRKFMACLFNKDYSDVENWDTLYLEYIDLSGIGENRELALMTNIHNLQVRLAHITSFIEFQKLFYLEFNQPYVKAFDDLRKYNHKLNWDPSNREEFLNQLKRVEAKEKRNVAELDVLIKELTDIKKGAPVVKEDHNSRADFIRMLNSLNKEGYSIDKDKTDMEELSLMIKQQNEEYQAALAAQNKN